MTAPPPGQWPPPPPPGPPWIPSPAGPKGSGTAKWILGGLALLVVVVVAVVATLLVTREDTRTADGPTETAGPATTADVSDIASADDDGPAGIILEDSTCASWSPIGDTLAQQQAKGWNDRDPLIPASSWTTEQRAQHEAVAEAMRTAADQTVTLARETPHRLMRELYEQSIAYWRAYSDRIPDYRPVDDHLARAATSTSNALVWICSAMTYNVAAARAPFVIDAPAPLTVAPVGNAADPSPFITGTTDSCADWHEVVAQFQQDTSAWLAIDPDLSAAEWTPEQQRIYLEAATIMEANAGRLQTVGIQSGNPVFQDFATLAAQYRRAYVSAIPSYTPADNYLASAASQLVAAIDEACKSSEQ